MLAANDVTVLVDAADRYTPTPAVSHAILGANGGRRRARARRRHRRHAIAQPAVGRWVQVQPATRRAGRHRRHRVDRRRGPTSCSPPALERRAPGAVRQRRERAEPYDFVGTYVDDLPDVVDLDAIRDAGVHIGADPLGGASVDYWAAIAERHRPRPHRRQPRSSTRRGGS